MSPAYDVAFAENDGWTRQHQMSVAGKFHGITRADCLRVADVFDIKATRAKEIIDRVLDAVAGWERLAAEVGVGDDFRGEMTARLRREGALLA